MPCVYFGAICWYQALHILVYLRSDSRGYHQVLWCVFKRTREPSDRTLEIVDNGITSFNSSWEQDSEESLTRFVSSFSTCGQAETNETVRICALRE